MQAEAALYARGGNMKARSDIRAAYIVHEAGASGA